MLYDLDLSSCPACAADMKAGAPMVWVREMPEGGRLFYMSMGSAHSTFTKNPFTRPLLYRGFLWAAKDAEISGPVHLSRPPGGIPRQRLQVGSGMGFRTGNQGRDFVELISPNGRRTPARGSAPAPAFRMP